MAAEKKSGYGDHFPGSRKIYKEGAQDGVRVPFREVALSPSQLPDGTTRENGFHRFYDASGPWTDETGTPDVRSGLKPLRELWIESRDDSGTSDAKPVVASVENLPDLSRTRRRARPGANVTQMHYARRGMITPEMEYIAIRENLGRDANHETDYARQNGSAGRPQAERRESGATLPATKLSAGDLLAIPSASVWP